MEKNTQQDGNGQKHKVSVRLVVRILCVIGLLCCLAWLFKYAADTGRNQRQAEEVRQEYVSTQEAPGVLEQTAAPETTPEPEEGPEPNLFAGREYPDLSEYEIPERDIDFAGLRETNPDVYAWLYVPDTSVDYPVLQREGDAYYYLTHDLEGADSAAGSIFTQYYNSKDWTDNHTVIYGHNMKNKSMFATLHNYEDSRFFDEHKYFYVYTPEYTLVYQVFAAYKSSNTHLLLNYNMGDHDSFQQYLDSVLAQDGIGVNIDRDIQIDADDHIITLSTCLGGYAQNRYLVQGKLAAVGKAAGTEETENGGAITGTAETGADR